MDNAHERPVLVAKCTGVILSGRTQMTDDPIRTFKLDTKIPTSGMLDVHRHGDVFHPFKVCTLELLSCDFEDTSQPLVALWDAMLDMYPR